MDSLKENINILKRFLIKNACLLFSDKLTISIVLTEFKPQERTITKGHS